MASSLHSESGNQFNNISQNKTTQRTATGTGQRATINNICATMNANIIVVLCSLFVELSAKKVQDLQIIVEHKPDSCKEFAGLGDNVQVEYTGMLENGNIFDTSMREGRSPLKFQLGSGSLIKGWERGIHGMCLGERRKLIIPPHLGYGSKAVGNVIPPNSVLIFTVHLVGLQKKSVMSKLRGLSGFVVWPLCVLSVIYYLYKKTKNNPEGERRLEKKSGKKKR